MSEFIVDQHGCHIWYDIKHIDTKCIGLNACLINILNQPEFYVRPHRLDGPAIIWPDGYQMYFIHGQKHREDGPAVMDNNGRNYWYLNDKIHLFDDWCKKLNKSKEEINYIRLKWNVI